MNNENQIKTLENAIIDTTGTIGSLMSGYIENYIKLGEIEIINKKIEKLNNLLKDFDLFKYKIINRIKIKNLIVKVLSENDNKFINIAVYLLNMSEENLENIIDGFMQLTKNDIDVLYYNLWKKRGQDKFDVISLKSEIGSNYEFVPDLIMSYAYRVNKDEFVVNKNSLIIGENLTLMPEQESSNIFNVFEKLSYNKFIKISMYIPDKTKDSFSTYLCFNFTYLGIHLCKIMEKIEKDKGDNNE